MPKQLHLNAFLMSAGHHEAAWRLPGSDPHAHVDVGHYIALAQTAERGKFDSIFFADSPVLAPLGALGSAHHERLDGSGYHRGLAGSSLSGTARLLAAANAWCALTEARPHRPQMTEAEAAAELTTQAKAGLFDRKAVDAVLTAAGQKGARARRAASVTLSEREIEVLRLLSRGGTNAAIADELGLSPKTVERHVTHIYDKLGVTTRAGAAIYALENGLL